MRFDLAIFDLTNVSAFYSQKHLICSENDSEWNMYALKNNTRVNLTFTA